ncbi:GTPase, partial [filamentous cyanobacterium CCT1]
HEDGQQPSDWQVEFIDTPGLDEIDGQARSEMAQTVAGQADLILFVVAGAITGPEAEALQRLRDCQKPLLLVFNKTDLYPDLDRGAIAAQLRPNPQASVVDEIVWIAADPAPVQVRTEWPDGRTTTVWEAAPPQIDDLRQVLKRILSRDAAALIALNTLDQARQTETAVIHQVGELYQPQAEALIWRFAQYKALAVALNPFALLDLLGGIASDLVMIRSLARLYGFPITSYQASKLWGSILRSSGLLLLSELGSLVLGAGKTTAALLGLSGSPASLSAVAGAMVAQASAAGYGTYVVGKAARTYLEQGCTWGPQGISAIMAQVIQETDTSETLNRLKQTIRESLSGADLSG